MCPVHLGSPVSYEGPSGEPLGLPRLMDSLSPGFQEPPWYVTDLEEQAKMRGQRGLVLVLEAGTEPGDPLNSHRIKGSWGFCVCPWEAIGLRNGLPGWLGRKDGPLLIPGALGLGQSQNRGVCPGGWEPRQDSLERHPLNWKLKGG